MTTRWHRSAGAIALLAGSLTACGGDRDTTSAVAASEPRSIGAPASSVAIDAHAPLVLFLGDSLTAGYGLDESQAYPALVAARLAADGFGVRVVNAGVSGDTSTGGLARLDWLLRQKPAVVVLALGGNDGLRGEPLAALESNLRAAAEKSRTAGARVVIAGMRIPTNYGPDYTRDFAAIYPRVAKETGATLIPFLLAGVGGESGLNQPDGIHPNAKGARRVAENVVAILEPVLTSAGVARGRAPSP